jgi:hypothetical protein
MTSSKAMSSSTVTGSSARLLPDGNHFSIEVTDGDTVRQTHLMPHGEAAVVSDHDKRGIMSIDLELPNASAALEFQSSTLGSWDNYDAYNNSCLTYCTTVLRQGGYDAPSGMRAMVWARNLLSGRG